MKIVFELTNGKEFYAFGIRSFEWGVSNKSLLFLYTEDKSYLVYNVRRIVSGYTSDLGFEFTPSETLRLMR